MALKLPCKPRAIRTHYSGKLMCASESSESNFDTLLGLRESSYSFQTFEDIKNYAESCTGIENLLVDWHIMQVVPL